MKLNSTEKGQKKTSGATATSPFIQMVVEAKKGHRIMSCVQDAVCKNVKANSKQTLNKKR